MFPVSNENQFKTSFFILMQFKHEKRLNLTHAGKIPATLFIVWVTLIPVSPLNVALTAVRLKPVVARTVFRIAVILLHEFPCLWVLEFEERQTSMPMSLSLRFFTIGDLNKNDSFNSTVEWAFFPC